MATTDPAVEAAERALAPYADRDHSALQKAARLGAREALARIRELHRLCEDDIHKRCPAVMNEGADLSAVAARRGTGGTIVAPKRTRMCPMASDPTDLIRDVDLVHVSGMMSRLDGPGVEECCAQCGTRWPCEVRRLRDALATETRCATKLGCRSDDSTEWTHLHPDDEGEPECAACWAQSIRRALKGEP